MNIRIVRGLLELIVVIASALLINWGALGKSTPGTNEDDRKRMSFLGFVLLISWLVLAGIPNFIKSISEDGELKKFKLSGIHNGNDHDNSDNHISSNGKKRKKTDHHKRSHKHH